VPNVAKQLWSYDEADTAPDVWFSLDKDYLFCDADITKSTGSPIDIQSSMAQQSCYGPSFEVQSAPSWEGSQAPVSELFDRSFIVDVANCKAGDGCQPAPIIPKTVDHDAMALERIVFHTPSEHKLNGETLDMEFQFMHCRASGNSVLPGCRPELGVAILFKDGGSSVVDPPFLTELASSVKVPSCSSILRLFVNESIARM
jgi:hypothetical protein